jgi:hypothetical protein
MIRLLLAIALAPFIIVGGEVVFEEPGSTSAQEPRAVSCDEFLQPPREVIGRKVGPSSCLSQESAVEMDGRAFVRLDVGLNGRVDGIVTKTGEYKEYLTNAPDLVFPQTLDPTPRLLAVSTYEREKGAAIVVVLPRDPQAWNGKMWVTAHGRGRSFKSGNLKAWDKNLDPANPLGDLNKYDRLILAKGYVLVKTHRTAAEGLDVASAEGGLAEIISTLEDGTTVDYISFNDTANYIKDFTDVARTIVQRRLARAPVRTYFYGHSAGARIGRGINYTPGLNRARDGRPVFDGMLLDDSAAGTWLPVVMKDGRDVLFASDAEKSAFVPQLEVTHQMYNNIWPLKTPDFVSSSYLVNKRNNARILRQKGLTPKHRMYEVRSISHSGGEALPDGRQGAIRILDMSLLMGSFIDMLDRWVDGGVAPPPSRSDWAPLGDTNGDGALEHPALAFPEVACPLGVYFPYPNTLSGTTSFAAFTGEGVEPLDENNVFADMNRNGVWDFRETPTAAWQRLGLLQKGEQLTRARYEACVERAVEELRREGFFSSETAASYIRQASTAALQPTAQ